MIASLQFFRRERMRTSRTRIVTIVIILILAALLIQTQMQQPATPDSAIPHPQLAPVSPKWMAKHLALKKVAESGKPKIMFLGDSITESWSTVGSESWKEFEKLGASNFGLSGDKTQNTLWRIEYESFNHSHPEILVLNIGSTNIIEGEVPAGVAAGIEEVVRQLQSYLPKTKIILTYLFPFALESDIQESIEQVNKLVNKISDNSIIKLDISSRLLMEDSEPVRGVLSGIQLTKSGYRIWADALLPLVNKILKFESNYTELSNEFENVIFRVNSTVKPEHHNTGVDRPLPANIERSFCINLRESTHRWKNARQKFIEEGLNVERFDAVGIQDILYDHLDVSLRARNFLGNRQSHEDLPSQGALGCYLSHASLWQKIVEENISSALIFEDDVKFTDDFFEKMEHYGSIMSNTSLIQGNTVDMLLLSARLRDNKQTSFSEEFIRIRGPFFSTLSYMITNRGARLLLREILPIEVQVDAYIGLQAKLEPQIGIYGVPVLVRDSGDSSTIQVGDPGVECSSEIHKVVPFLIISMILNVCFVIYLGKKYKEVRSRLRADSV